MPLIRDKKPLAMLIAEHNNTNINDLTTDMQVLFGLLKLVIDIQYRNRYETGIEKHEDGE